MWSKMKIRVISGAVGVLLLLGIIFSPEIVFELFIGAVCLVALYELHKTFHLEKKWPILGLQFLFAGIFLAAPFIPGGFQRSATAFLLVSYLMLTCMSAIIWHETISLKDVLVSFFGLFYAVLMPSHLINLRMAEHGVFLIFIPLLGAFAPDTFAYFSGMLFGKHKLIPKISPNKTVEGSVGAVLGTVLAFLGYGLVVSYGFGFSVHYLPLVLLALLCGILSQFGDLSASLIKRTYDVKDFGHLIPGHGGILDRLDSLIFVIPTTYYFLTMFEVIYK